VVLTAIRPSAVLAEAASGTISTVAGTGASGFSGDGGPATAATMSGPAAVTVSQTGDLYIADPYDKRVRKISGPAPTVAVPELPVFGLVLAIAAAIIIIINSRRPRRRGPEPRMANLDPA
jgi:hypothetical protein